MAGVRSSLLKHCPRGRVEFQPFLPLIIPLLLRIHPSKNNLSPIRKYVHLDANHPSFEIFCESFLTHFLEHLLLFRSLPTQMLLQMGKAEGLAVQSGHPHTGVADEGEDVIGFPGKDSSDERALLDISENGTERLLLHTGPNSWHMRPPTTPRLSNRVTGPLWPDFRLWLPYWLWAYAEFLTPVTRYVYDAYYDL